MNNILDVKCTFCSRVFCCKNCRLKHETFTHSKEINTAKKIVPVTKDKCPVCNDNQFPLSKNFLANNDLLQHIEETHLPLRCSKCSAMYTKIDDLKTFTNCKKSEICNHERITVKEENVIALNSIATQTSPKAVDDLVPIVLDTSSVNALSLKINSSANGSKNCTPYELIAISSAPKKIVGTTSTPVQSELSGNQGEASSGLEHCQVSSIHASSAISVNSSSAIQSRNNSEPSKLARSCPKRNQFTHSKRKSIIMTPLRRVMSKSIQRAIAEYRTIDSNISSPLDLRTSPVIRRTQSNPETGYKPNLVAISSLQTPKSPYSNDGSNIKKEILFSGKKVTTMTTAMTKTTTTKSIFIASVSCSNEQKSNKENDIIYGTGHSVKFINEEIHQEFLQKISDEEKLLNDKCRDCNNFQLTPKFPFVLPLKKVISFDTPSEIRRSNSKEELPLDKEDEESEVFYTPLSSPTTSFSDSQGSGNNLNEIKQDNVREYKITITDNENNKENTEKKGFWSVIRAVMKLPLLWTNVYEESVSHEKENYYEFKEKTNFLLANDSNEYVRQKRKRVHFIENPVEKDDFTEDVHHCNCSNCEIPPKRIKHIQGRRPIRTNVPIATLKIKQE